MRILLQIVITLIVYPIMAPLFIIASALVLVGEWDWQWWKQYILKDDLPKVLNPFTMLNTLQREGMI
jgi:hypothetical protein